MFRRFTALIFTAALLLIGGCMAPSAIIRQDQAPEKTQQKASEDYKAAEKLFQAGRMPQALLQFQAIAKQHYNTTSADNALLRIAQIYKREKNIKTSESTLKKLIHQYPTSDVKFQALRELTAINMQQLRYGEALEYMIDIDLKKLSSKDQASLNSAAAFCIQKTGRSDLALMWKINYSVVNTTPEYRAEIINQLNGADKHLLEKIIDKRKVLFPAKEASILRYKIAKQENDSDTKRWAFYIVEHFPTSEEAQALRVEISEPIPLNSSAESYNIGVLLPLTGEQESYGNQVLNGIKTAIEMVKLTNPSRNIQLVVEDVGAGGDAARQAVQKLLVEHQVIALIGPLNSKDTEAIADLAQTNSLPVLSLSPAENVTQFGSTVFRNSITKNEQAVSLAKFLWEVMGIHRAAILYPNNSYGKEFMELFWNEFEKRGGEIRGAEEYDRNVTDFATPIKKMVGLWRKDLRRNEICSKSQADQWTQMKKIGGELPKCYPIEQLPPIVDFEAIFVPDSYDKARQILPTLLYYDVKGVQVLGTNLWNTDELLAGTVGNEMEGALFLDGFYKSSPTPEVVEFMQKYYELYNAEPGILEAQGFDSAMSLLHILIKKSPSSREGMVKQLTKMNNYKGVTGLTGFNGDREAIRNINTLIIDQNKIVPLR